MNKEQIENRIQQLMTERALLDQTHNVMVRNHQKVAEEFQQEVVKNQTRFAQMSGAIAELQQLLKAENQQPTQKATNNDNLPTTTDLHHRTPHVRAGIESEDR